MQPNSLFATDINITIDTNSLAKVAVTVTLCVLAYFIIRNQFN